MPFLPPNQQRQSTEGIKLNNRNKQKCTHTNKPISATFDVNNCKRVCYFYQHLLFFFVRKNVNVYYQRLLTFVFFS